MRSPHGAAVAAVVLVCVPLWTGTTNAADKCLSRGEARALWPQRHLYWYFEGSQRCWSDRRRSARRAVRGGTFTPSPPAPLPPINSARANTGSRPDGVSRTSAAEGDGPKPTLLPTLVVLPAGLMPPYHEPPPGSGPRWDWIEDARADARGVVFSTFPGEPPDTWPALTRETPPAGTGGLLVVVASAMAAMVFGLMVARWHLHRLRI